MKRVAGALLSGTALLDGVPASAQEPAAAPSVMEEVIVTARKRDESLLDVPAAVTVLSAQAVERYAATDLSKIGQLVPQVMFVKVGGGGSGGALVIRGLGSSAEDAGIEQSVAVNIDGVQFTRGRVATQSFFDVQQIEVLKGPQALFFGKNSPGGVVSITTAGPRDSFEAYSRVGYELKADERYVEGAVSGPISDTLGVRLAARASKMEGYMRNVAQPQENPFDVGFPLPGASDRRQPDSRDIAGRLTVAWQPESPFKATLKLFASDYKDNAQTVEEVICPAGRVPTTYGVPDPTGDCDLDGVRSVSDLPRELTAGWSNARDGRAYSQYEAQYGTLRLDYDSELISLASVSGYYNYDQEGVFNVDFTSWGQGFSVNNDAYTALSQELRAVTKFDGPFNFMLGAFYEDVDYDQETDAKIFALGPDPRNGKYVTWERPAVSNGENVSFFGQAIWSLADDIELAAGARWVREKKSVRMFHRFFHSLFPEGIFLPEGTVVEDDYDDENVSPEVTLTYHPTPQATLYAAYKTGYKSGGFSIPSALTADYADPNQARFDAEEAEGGEIGAKGAFLDSRLWINASIYRYTFDGLQLSSFNADTTSFTIRNAAKARTTGAELEAQFSATKALSLHGAVGYNRARYASFPTGACYQGQTIAQGCTGTPDPDNPAMALDGRQDLSDTPLVRAPDWTATAGFAYDMPLTAQLRLVFTGDVNYSSSYITQENQDPLARQDAFTRINASLRLHDGDERWELAFIGRNLTNKRYIVSSGDKPFGEPGELAVTPSRPRELAFQGTLRF